VAPGRAIPTDRLHGDQPDPTPTSAWSSVYNGRGTAEQWIKEGKDALRWTRLSCHAFRHNAVRLQLHALAYNLATFLRTLVLPQEVEPWSLTRPREKLVKIGARIVRHGRYVVFQLAEMAVPRALFAEILRRIERLRRPPIVAA
jgi:Transposase DDE domain group 1